MQAFSLITGHRCIDNGPCFPLYRQQAVLDRCIDNGPCYVVVSTTARALSLYRQQAVLYRCIDNRLCYIVVSTTALALSLYRQRPMLYRCIDNRLCFIVVSATGCSLSLYRQRPVLYRCIDNGPCYIVVSTTALAATSAASYFIFFSFLLCSFPSRFIGRFASTGFVCRFAFDQLWSSFSHPSTSGSGSGCCGWRHGSWGSPWGCWRGSVTEWATMGCFSSLCK